jgi:hypothetical protein
MRSSSDEHGGKKSWQSGGGGSGGGRAISWASMDVNVTGSAKGGSGGANAQASTELISKSLVDGGVVGGRGGG